MDKELDFTINYWKSRLLDKGLYTPTTIYFIERAVFYLRELKEKLEREEVKVD